MRLMRLLPILLLLAGCLPPSQSQLRMEMDLEEMKRHLAKLEVAQADSRAGDTAGGDSLQRQVAELVAGLDNLRVEFQSVNGRLDDLGRDNQQLVDDLQFSKEDVGLQLDALNGRLDQLDQHSAEVTAKLTAVATAPAAGTAPPAEAVKPELTAEQAYQQALDLVRTEKSFAAGREQLEQFYKAWPDHDLAVNALYWSGEALYGEKEYELAILRLQDVISKHSSHSKAPAAMYKQGLAFDALGDKENAKTTLLKMIEDYPQADQVAAAQKYLAK